MNAFLRKLPFEQIALLACFTIIVGLLFSRAMMSIGMIALPVIMLLHPDRRIHWKGFLSHKPYLLISGIFVLYLISGLFSEDSDFYTERLLLKLPFLFLPFAFYSLGLTRKHLYGILYFLFLLILICSIWLMGQYLLNFEEITELYQRGQVLPTPIPHIRFSLMVVLAIVIGIYLPTKKYFILGEWEKYLLNGGAAVLIIFIHLLAVRSGLLGLYAIGFYFVLKEIILGKKVVLLMMIIIGVPIIGFLSYQYIPTIKNKVNYTRYSLEMFMKKENYRDLSDSRRLASVMAGIDMIRKKPITGVGVGNVRLETDRYLKRHYPSLAALDLLPHNQYVFVFAGAGIFGLLYFLYALLFPIFYKKAFQDTFVISFHLLILTSFIVEHTVETQIGTAFYILFLLLGVKLVDTNPTPLD